MRFCYRCEGSHQNQRLLSAWNQPLLFALPHQIYWHPSISIKTGNSDQNLNLLPSSSQLKRQKSDRVPSEGIFLGAQTRIQDWWVQAYNGVLGEWEA